MMILSFCELVTGLIYVFEGDSFLLLKISPIKDDIFINFMFMSCIFLIQCGRAKIFFLVLKSHPFLTFLVLNLNLPALALQTRFIGRYVEVGFIRTNSITMRHWGRKLETGLF